MKTIGLLMGILLLASAVFAQDAMEETQLGMDISSLEGSTLPSFAKSLFGDQRINIHLSMNNGDAVYGVVTENGIVTEVQEEEIANPTLNVYTNEQVIMDIANADDSLQELRNALDDGRIEYAAIGLGNKIKFGLASFFITVASWFSGEDEQLAEDASAIETADDSSQEAETTSNNGITGSVVVAVPLADEEVSVDNSVNEQIADITEVEAQEEQVNDEPQEPRTTKHQVMMTSTGFEPRVLHIKKGDTVVWEVAREGQLAQGMILGMRNCFDVRSDVFKPGDRFEWTFDKVETCVLVDGMMTTADSKVIVEE